MNLTARDIMSHPPVSITEDSTIRDLVALLHEKRFSGMPVVDGRGQLRGVITLTDLLAIEPNKGTLEGDESSDFYTSPAMDGLSDAAGLFTPTDETLERPVRDLMSKKVITSTEEDSIGTVADLMASNRIHRVVVVRGPELVGIISVMDILRALRDLEAA